MLTVMIAVMLVIMIGIAIICGWLGFKGLTKSVWLHRQGRRGKGKVVRIDMEDAGDSQIRWVTVAYSVAGEDYLYRYWTGQFVMDQEVTLLHEPDHPRNVRVLDWTTLWLVPLVLLFPIVIAIGAGILALALQE